MDTQLQQLLEATLSKHVPAVVTGDEVEERVGAARYSRDNNALTRGFAEPAHEFIQAGGKRVRPRFFFHVLQAFDVENLEDYVELAAVVEIAHNATLVIDDVEDQSELRRGKPTMHKASGIDVAVNTGVLLHLLPLQSLMAVSVLSSEQRATAIEIYVEELVAVYHGQALDIAWHQAEHESTSQEQYLEMCRLKTGGLLRMAARLACLVTSQDVSVTTQVASFAEAAGIAFQIRDDVLDLTADEQEFGKAFGNDITEGKMSLPVILALAELAPEERSELLSILESQTHDHKTILRAHELIQRTGAIAEAMSVGEHILSDAWKGVQQNFTGQGGKRELEALVNSFIARTR